MTTPPSFLQRADKQIAYRQTTGKGPGLLWLGGYASDMRGTKAAFLDDWARENNRHYTRFDYTGHGESSGDFEDGCLTDWSEDALAILDKITGGPQILIGSSMGGWVASLIAKKRPEKIAGIIYIAPAPDFTKDLMWPSWDQKTRDLILKEGKVSFPSSYDDSVMVYTRKLIEDGEHNLIFPEPLMVNAPVRIIQGMADDVVPTKHALKLATHIESPDVQITLVKNGDHRLSSEKDLLLLQKIIENFPD